MSQTVSSPLPREPGRLGRLWALLRRPLGRQASKSMSAGGLDPTFEPTCEALRQALKRAGGSRASRRRWRRLDIFETWLRRHGAEALDRLPSGYLHRVNLQLQGLIAGNALLQALSARIETTVARRMAAADADRAPLSAMEFSSLVEVAEVDGDEALLEFAKLWADEASGDEDPGTTRTQPRRLDPDADHPITRPQML
jgi:hypothetical protein